MPTPPSSQRPAQRDSYAGGPVVALAGGVGAARLLRGLIRVVPPELLTVVVNTGDDRPFYGVEVCPDLDIVTYTLAGVVDAERGFGLAGDRHDLIGRLAELGHDTWFGLGDADYANCLHRTLRLRAGVGLAEVTDELRRAYGVGASLLPMSEDACPTLVSLRGGRVVHFEEYLIRDGAPDEVTGVDLSAAAVARPGPGVLDAIAEAALIVLCPSNPVVSIGPILAVPGIRDAVSGAKSPVVAVSPIIGGSAVKGPAAQLLRGTGTEVSALGVARLYSDLAGGIVIDDRDAALAGDIHALGLATATTDTLMVDTAASTRVAEAVMSLAGTLA